MSVLAFTAGVCTGLILVVLLVVASLGLDVASDTWRRFVRGFQRNPR